MILFKKQNNYYPEFNDQVIIGSYPVSLENNNIYINIDFTYMTKAGVIKTERKIQEISDEYVEDIDIDFLDKDNIIVDPQWKDKPENFDLYKMETWPEGMVYPDIPKVIKPGYIAQAKYFSRLYDIILSCASDDEIKLKIFKFISIEEPHFLENLLGSEDASGWIHVKINEDELDDVESIKSHKIQMLKSIVGSKILKKYGVTKQLNYMSDNFYSLKTLSGYLGKDENDIMAQVTNKIGVSDNIIDLNNINVNSMDFSDILSGLKNEYGQYQDLAKEAVENVAESILAHKKISAMRSWSKSKENEISSAESMADVVKLMNNLKVPEV